MPEAGDGVCPCEGHGHGELGPVGDDEVLMRLVVSPRHIARDGSVKPSLFPTSHIQSSGLSLMRRDHMNAESAKVQAEAIAATANGAPVGFRMVSAKVLRAEVDKAGARALCVIDDPVIGQEPLPDNPAHAYAIQSRPSEGHDHPDVQQIQSRLVKAFGDVVRVDDVY